MYIQTQFSIFLINKPGVLAQTLNKLAENKINITAMTMMDSVEHGVLRLVTEQTAQAREVFKKLSVPVNETDVLCVNIPNHAGAFADVTGKLAAAHVNINYAYVTAGARGGRTTGVLKVADLKKALKVLSQADSGMAKKAKTNKNVRRTPDRNT